MNKLSTLLTTAVLTSALLTSPILASKVQAKEVTEQTKKHSAHKNKRAKKMKHHFKRMAKHLQLTSEQKTQVKECAMGLR